VNKVFIILFVIMFACIGCEWQLRPGSDDEAPAAVTVERYDRMEAFFLTTGDYSSMQQMQTHYPVQTRLLIENVLQLGKVDAANINTRFYHFFQDSTLQEIIEEVGRQYGNMDDINGQLSDAFVTLQQMIPDLTIPMIYTQIGSLDQSLVVSDSILGISLDKYLGEDFEPYHRFGYTERQRSMMTRSYIVPDCLGFYLLSLYPFPGGELATQEQRDEHMGHIQFVVNRAMHYKMFENKWVEQTEHLMAISDTLTYKALLQGTTFSF